MIFKTRKNYEIQGLLIGICGIILFAIYAYWEYNKEYKLLHDNEVRTFGIVNRLFTIKITKHHLGYKFKVNNKLYYGIDSYKSHLQDINFGDTVEIIYSSKDPNINEALRRENKSLLVVKPVIYKSEFDKLKDSLEKDDFYLLKDSMKHTALVPQLRD